MNLLAISLSGLSGLLLLSTLLCGLWMRSHGVTPEGVQFHAGLALWTIGVTLITVIALLAMFLRK